MSGLVCIRTLSQFKIIHYHFLKSLCTISAYEWTHFHSEKENSTNVSQSKVELLDFSFSIYDIRQWNKYKPSKIRQHKNSCFIKFHIGNNVIPVNNTYVICYITCILQIATQKDLNYSKIFHSV